MKLRIGVTGNCCAGKSTVCEIFDKDWNIPIYDTDKKLKKLIADSYELRLRIAQLLGNKVFVDNIYPVDVVADIIFDDRFKKKGLEDIIEEYLMRDYAQWLIDMDKEKHSFVVVESALFYETSSQHMTDVIVSVSCPLPLRIERGRIRNGLDYDRFMRIEKSQLSEEEKVSRSHFNITNDGSVSLADQVGKLFGLFDAVGYQINESKSKYEHLLSKGVAYGVHVGAELERQSRPRTGWQRSEPDKEIFDKELLKSCEHFLHHNW